MVIPPETSRHGYETPADCLRHILARVIYVAWEDLVGGVEGDEDIIGAEEFFNSPVYRYYMECLGRDPDLGIEDMEVR